MEFKKRAFTKKDLRPSMVILTSDGEYRVINKDITIASRKNGFIFLNEYDDKLRQIKFDPRFEILYIYTSTQDFSEFLLSGENRLGFDVNVNKLKLICKMK